MKRGFDNTPKPLRFDDAELWAKKEERGKGKKEGKAKKEVGHLITRLAHSLYQLRFLAETTGFEPATFGLTGQYANRYTTPPDDHCDL